MVLREASSWSHRWATAATGQAGCDFEAPQSVFSSSPQRCDVKALYAARELLADGFDNDNPLCESFEQCVVAPNAGAYQGHGPLLSSPFTLGPSGTVQPSQMLRHQSNGR